MRAQGCALYLRWLLKYIYHTVGLPAGVNWCYTSSSDVLHSNSRNGSKFRLRFRVLYPLTRKSIFENHRTSVILKATYAVKGKFLNTKSHKERGLCTALLANSLLRVWNFAKGKPAAANCKLKAYASGNTRKMGLVCRLREEISWNYGAGYMTLEKVVRRNWNLISPHTSSTFSSGRLRRWRRLWRST